MKNWMKAAGLAVAIAGASPAALAATYYLSDCQAGAAAGCVPGSSANDGLSPAKPKQTWDQLPARKGGDTILFAKGGAWTNASMRIHVPTASAASPVTWDSYTPPWGGVAKPILTESRTGKSLFSFDDGGQKAADGGYVIRNLALRGGGVLGGPAGADFGVFLYWAVNDVLMENLEISGFKVGVHAAHLPKAANGWENHRVVLRSSNVHDNSVDAFLGGAADLLIENNTFDRNGSTAIFDHTIYISSAVRGVIRNNVMTRSVLDRAGKCAASVIVVHGTVEGLVIEGNKIVQPAGGGIPQCFGIEVSGGYADSYGVEYFRDVSIRGNVIVDVGHVGIGVRGCTGCVVESNAIVWTGAAGNQGISMAMNNPSNLDERGTELTVRNNSIYMQAPVGEVTGVRLINEGTNHTITGNLILFGGSPNSAPARCFDTSTYAIANFAMFNNNLCFRPTGNLAYSVIHKSLDHAKAAGFDVDGLSADPILLAPPTAANGFSLAIAPHSPAAKAAHPTLSAAKDIAGQRRGTTPDIGAHQVTPVPPSKAPPLPPSSVIVR